MGEAVPNPPPGFDDLPPEDQIDYVQSLWDRIAGGDDPRVVPEWHARIVRERLAAYHADPSVGRDWEDVRRDIQGQLDKTSER